MTEAHSHVAYPQWKGLPANIDRAKTCQWIEGLPSEMDSCKCGIPSIEGSSYCMQHYKKSINSSYTKYQKKRDGY